ncbi:MAG TPA: metalloregulator ArsR/SmtB family transcription factor [Algoriphagus sp.]|nr:metalloregulator ArsR/SmtB family transcription factor [Algoriphagus sp.]
MEARRDVFQAIADPTRRAILGMVSKQATNVNAIAGQFEVSRQAISLHLKILAECGLLQIRQQGRERICEAKLENLAEVNQWVSQYRKFWTHKLDALENYLDTTFNIDTDAKPGENIEGK